MIGEQDIQLARKVFQIFNERRFDELEGSVFSTALVYRHHNRESDLRRWLQDARNCVESFPDAQLVIESEAADGDRLILNYRLRGTHLGPLGRAQPTGRSFDVPARSTFRFLDGLIVEVDDYVDERLLDAQLALV